MIDGAKKIPEPMTLPTMRSVASNRPSPRTSSRCRGVRAGLVSAIRSCLLGVPHPAESAEDSTAADATIAVPSGELPG